MSFKQQKLSVSLTACVSYAQVTQLVIIYDDYSISIIQIKVIYCAFHNACCFKAALQTACFSVTILLSARYV